MLRKLRPRLTYANVVSTLCLFILLGGSAYAAATITGDDVVDSSLTGADIKGKPSLGFVDGSLDTYDIRNKSLLSSDVATNTLTAGELGSNSVSTSELKDGSVTNAKLAPGATKVIVRRSSIGATATGGGNIVDCQGAEHVMGGGVGGFGQDGGQPVVLASQPDNGDTTTPPTAWAGEIANRAGAGTVGGTVSAICASP